MKILKLLLVALISWSIQNYGAIDMKKAVKDNNMEDIKALVDNGNIDEFDVAGYTLLIYAVKNKNKGLVKFLLEKGAYVNQVHKYFHKAPLIYACMVDNPSIEVVKLLLSQPDIDVDVFNTTGDTSLHIAVSNSNLDLVDTLLQGVPNATMKNLCHLTAIESILKFNYKDEYIHRLLLIYSKEYLPAVKARMAIVDTDITDKQMQEIREYALNNFKLSDFGPYKKLKKEIEETTKKALLAPVANPDDEAIRRNPFVIRERDRWMMNAACSIQ